MIPTQDPDPERLTELAEFERLTTAARVYRMRGDYPEAENSIRRALEIRPDDLDAQEFAADMILARGELEQAAAEFKRIHEAAPGRASAEEKYARVIVQIAEARRQRELLREMLDNPSKFRPPARSPLAAAVLSAAPGFGHIYCGQLVKGIVLFVGTMLAWLLFYALSPPVQSYLPPPERTMRFVQDLSPAAILFVCIAVFSHVYAFVDAAVLADKHRATQNAE